jgi:hypothetical protein
MSWLGNGFFPDTTQDADRDVGSYDEPQVLIKGRRMISMRGNRQGAKQAFPKRIRWFVRNRGIWATDSIRLGRSTGYLSRHVRVRLIPGS